MKAVEMKAKDERLRKIRALKNQLWKAGVDTRHDATLEDLEALFTTTPPIGRPFLNGSTSPKTAVSAKFDLTDRTTRRHPSPTPPSDRSKRPIDPALVHARPSTPKRTTMSPEERAEWRELKDTLHRIGAHVRHDATLQELRDSARKPKAVNLPNSLNLFA